MKTTRHTLIAIATLAAALSAAPAFAKAGKYDVYSDGAKAAKYDVYSDGAKSGKFDTYSDGAKYDLSSDRMPL
ncbi:hypothetical protein CupriaWKF_17160 [Cupriavidus sp. WKF15]|uniref:hypothetical protein n=1 Tax=Cupriavidus sp. WKF15 TaxID=3032282 RepID=UPI0023E268B5|nr:hypothetical protein [Cupriavidus sp. WKF15]WER45973.1 hypothetical protein CupriaWKF_17160 [Cupriavidus sp. WKF15]